MDIWRCQKIAEKDGYDSAEFWADFPAGRKRCKWLDAYFGMLTIPDAGDGFIMVKDIDEMFPNLNCEPIEA